VTGSSASQRQWPGAIAQMRGTSGRGLRDEQWPSSRSVTATAGDVLLIPPGVCHDVSIPDYPARLAFTFLAGGGQPGPGRGPGAL
jgi:hypothetical protein